MSRSSMETLRAALRERPCRDDLEPGPERRAAVAIVLSPLERESTGVLLIRRAECEGDPWSGHMALPGGRIEPGEPPELAAVREALEEVGLDLGVHGRCLGRLEDHQALSGGVLRPMAVSPFVFSLESEPGPFRLDRREVSEAVWVPLEALASGRFSAEFTWSRPGIPAMRLPCWDYRDYRIWGLTHRILTTLLGLAGF